jgi:serine/threonine protein kinase
MIELAAGTMVTPSVRLERLLGEGAMGSVWVAEHTALETRVAVKFISHTRSKDRTTVIARFEREAKAAARIKSPHVVHMYDHGVMDGNTPYIVMELLEGETLGSRIRHTGGLRLSEVRTVVTHVAKALMRAHKLGIVHRDIKPDNIFLAGSDDDLFVKVLDFGIAKSTAEDPGHTMTQTGAILGTPLYMSPELVKSAKEADARADLWALAVAAYEAVTGKLPFSGETVGALFFSICGDAITPPSELRGGVPAELDAWFSRALRQEADKRFATARELSTSFRLAIEGAEDPDAAPQSTTAADVIDDAALATQDFVSKHQLKTEVVTSPDDSIEEPVIEGSKEQSTLEGTAVEEAGAEPDAGPKRSTWRPVLVRSAAAAAVVAAIGLGFTLFTEEPQPEASLAAATSAVVTSADPAPTATASASAEPGELELDIIAAIIDTKKEELRDCYRDGLKRVKDLPAKVELTLAITGGGRVDSAKLEDMKDDATRRCVEKLIGQLRFPAPGGEVNTKYPLVLDDRPAPSAVWQAPPKRYGANSNVGSVSNVGSKKSVSSKKKQKKQKKAPPLPLPPPPQKSDEPPVQQQRSNPFE